MEPALAAATEEVVGSEREEAPPVVYTMENKPIVTCAGDQNLFSSLYPTLSQQLPREPMEWRRSYGRAPKMIHLESNFVQFKEELLPKEGNKALLTFPFLHIYWTECCDTEVYKATVKDDITKWQNVLKVHSSMDWLIVVVECDAKKKNKTNILPRTSIVDKIRNDFCNKQSDRCVVLSDPLKDSSRSQESWNAFLTKLRTLLLMSFTKNLGKFEDDMRTLREKRTEPGWSFCEYFMVQEELAFVFEMLQQFEDALVQYDELDALFSQYVVNFGAGDGANWLTFFCQPVRSWNGLVLRKPIDMEKRELIQNQEATLLDLRSYLFSRQCTLLIFLQRPWEVSQRALELLHNCVQELKLLEVSVPPGALDCWVFLSCQEVLQRIEGCCDRSQIDANVSHMVGLWSYATEKLKSLGYLCGLVSENGPNSEDLNRTVDLLAGLGAERPETANTAQSPYKKLKEALSSVEAFEKHYLDLSHATIEMYTNIGRVRSAKLVGKDLAEFYMKKRSPQKAEVYLQGALKTYLSEGWPLLITHTRKQLAECQKHLGQIENYLQTSSLLAADTNLTEEERKHFCQEILNFAKQPSDGKGQKVILSMHPFAQLKNLHFDPPNAVIHVGGTLSIELTLVNQMPVTVNVDQIAINVHFNIEKNSYRKTAEWLTKHKISNGIINFPNEVVGFSLSRSSVPMLELYEMYERSPSDNSLNTTGIICKNVHMLLRRQESSSSLELPTGLTLEDGAHVLKCSNLILEPGVNKLTFRTQGKEPGTYTLRQLCISVGKMQFALPHIYPIVQYDVYSQDPQLKVEPCTEKASEASLTIQSSEKITSISLPMAPAYHVIAFDLEVLYLPSTSVCTVENKNLPGKELWRKNKENETFHNCMATVDQKVTIDCPWSIYSTIIALTFSIPFKAKYSLLSAGKRKYIQVCVQNMSEICFHLSDSNLKSSENCTDLILDPLNSKVEQHIYNKQAVFFVWELKWTRALPTSLQCQFSVNFCSAPSEEHSLSLKPYIYEFQLENFFTLYNVKAEISPPLGAEYCKTGSLCSLEVSITRLSDLLDVDKDEALTESDGYCTTKLLYEVVDNSSNWAVCGKSSGVISMPVAAQATHKVHMEVMPLFAGCLPIPDVRVFKYLPHHSAHSIQLDADSWIENDNLSVDKNVDDQADNSSIKSRSSIHSATSAEHKGLPMPRLQPFSPGQVFNSSAGMQVLVIPSKDDHILEVNVT
ncbi:trafficking protein particle complex subunit 10 isoform X2 [Sphaerodactylus townsendi]|uniref:trafficking protein particle complex subunit 10 isoform X2 n=1 Tax=Sphaerodactylus townsendi TaxID=933632 RepID=UPI0020276055|nr:trafficking protein particle complex subunit 10 isoform X2 [Sphaerodactylus townsendi]